MEEKHLIKSEHYSMRKVAIFTYMCACGLIAILGFLIVLPLVGEYVDQWRTYNTYHSKIIHETYSSGYEYLWKMTNETIFMVILIPMVLATIVFAILYFSLRNTELVVTDKRISGKAANGKRVDLPLDSISAIALSFMKGIAFATSSGRIKFKLIKNRDAIYDTVSKLLIERQNKTQPISVQMERSVTSNAAELKEYKELLDSGVITEEEFNAKKKQLLGS